MTAHAHASASIAKSSPTATYAVKPTPHDATPRDTTPRDTTTHDTTPHDAARSPGSTTGAVRGLLRLEALAAFVASLVAYNHLGGAWSTFAALFLLPDLAFLGYLAGPRVGAVAYDTTHSWLGPAALALVGAITGLDVLWLVAIWAAHLGFDRALGYGLKYATGFAHTHLGVVGRARSERSLSWSRTYASRTPADGAAEPR
jgi:hypothetical protein